MLIDIRSQKFRTGSVSFHEGLNVVIGDANATNSIGKSTMLMVIDFAFGGKDLLVHNKDVVTELGHHDYFITFQFGEEIYRFCRDTGQPETVFTCDTEFKLDQPWTLDRYNAFLSQAYEVELLDLSFRNLVGLFMRIWGKENLDPAIPLHVVPSKKGEDCVDDLIKTFDRYGDIRDVSRKLDDTEKELKAWSAAKNYKVIPAIKKKAYEDNHNRIATLERELEDVRSHLAQYTSNVSEMVNRELLELKEEKDRLLDVRMTVASRYQRVQNNLRNSRTVRSENFKELANFFPTINQDRLAKVEEFHSGVARLLRAELSASELQLDQELELIDAQLREIDARMAKSLNSVEVPTVIVDRIAEVAVKIRNAREENDRYDSETKLRVDVQELRLRLHTEKEMILAIVEKNINDGMRRIMTERFGPDRKSPHLGLRDKGYSFEVEEDTGTGVAYTGLVLFDLTVFLETKLPLLVHDTVVFKNIENDSVARLLPVYLSTSKQSFIALDEIEKYGSETVDVIKQHTVLELDDRRVLYIKDWRNKKSQ